MDLNNYNLGKYIAYAVNDPKKYPKKPFLYNIDVKKKKIGEDVMSDEEMEKMMRLNTKLLGGKIIK